MPSIPFWEDSPESWDQIVIAGQPMPGQAIVTGNGIGRKLDVKSGPGRDGARVRDRGYDPAQFTIEIRAWEDAQFRDLLPRLDELQPKRRGGERQPFDVAHPALSILGIRAMYVERVSLPTIKDGVFSVTISAIEYAPDPRPRPIDPRVVMGNAWVTAFASGGAQPSRTTAFEQHEAARSRPSTDP